MSQISGLSSITGLGSWVNQGTEDVTPNAVNWSDTTDFGEVYTSSLLITGISTPITLRISWTSSVGAGTGTFSYSLNNENAFLETATLTSSPTDIAVSNRNQYLGFKLAYTSSVTDRIVTITNVSDNNTVLDTFTIRVEFTIEPP